MIMDGMWDDDVVRLTSRDAMPSLHVQQACTSMPMTRATQPLLAWAQGVGRDMPDPGTGQTQTRWEMLATVASRDLVAARVLEPHVDALAILHEAAPHGVDPGGATWGVWAAEGPGVRLEASQQESGWLLDGVKPWCSLAGEVSAGLVTAWVDERRRGLFAMRTSDTGFSADVSSWSPSGLVEIATATVTMREVPAHPVGGPGWYLTRPGFGWGGIGVAAVWFGAAVALARRLLLETTRRPPDDIALLHLGEVDARLTAARVLLAHAADEVDAGRAQGAVGAHLAARVRHVVAAAAEEVLMRTAHGLGPGPLSQEPEHARRVADLSLYLRQHHAERDAVALGRMLVPDPSR